MNIRPSVSVIVPTHGRPEALASCLAALARQKYPTALETIVVDDASPQAAAIERVVSGSRARVKLLRQPHAGPAAARNRGAAVATSQLLAFTDDDCEPEESWVEQLVEAWSKGGECLVGGVTINRLSDNLYATASQVLLDYLYEYLNRDTNNGRFFAANNVLVAADHFRQLGGFNEQFSLAAGEDRDFCERWRASGRRLVSAPLARVRHGHEMTFRGFVRQHLQYGQGAELFWRLRAARTQERIRVEPFRFYLDMARYPFRGASGLRACVLVSLLGVTQVVNFAGFANARFRRVASSPSSPDNRRSAPDDRGSAAD